MSADPLSLERVRALIEQWRQQEDWPFRVCADELEALVGQDGASPPRQLQHGRDCPKAWHSGGGYLHDAGFEGPYDVDGVMYCGRCHGWIGSEVLPPKSAS